jgi:hypothetical protein
MVNPIQSTLLATLPGIQHGFFTRQGGVSPPPFDTLNFYAKYGDTPENVQENRRRAAAWFGRDVHALLIPQLTHGSDVALIEKPFTPDQCPKADALITQQPHQIIAITMADCVPILLADPQSQWIAAIHAGWRGALKGIIERTIQMLEQQGCERQHLFAAIGPAIQQESYEVGEDIMTAFIRCQPDFEPFFQRNPAGRYQFDLPGLINYRLQCAGVTKVDWLKLDTYSNPELFFSCRRNAHHGLKIFGDMMAGIMLQS